MYGYIYIMIRGVLYPMKKMTIRIPAEIIVGFDHCFPFFERMEILSLFNIGADVHTKVCRFKLREGVAIEEIRDDRIIRDLIVLRNEDREYTCIMKGELPDEINRFIRAFDLKIEYPIIIENRTCTINLIGSADELHAIITAAAEKKWELEILAVEKYDPHISALFNVLTTKQKEILVESYRQGYFDYPRQVNAGQLAEKMGMHKTTLLEHIHKAEKRLIGHILAQTV